jgi:hypothetical protein
MLAYFMSDSNRAYVKYTISAPMEGLVGPRPPDPIRHPTALHRYLIRAFAKGRLRLIRRNHTIGLLSRCNLVPSQFPCSFARLYRFFAGDTLE